jgi:hypothetical protein
MDTWNPNNRKGVLVQPFSPARPRFGRVDPGESLLDGSGATTGISEASVTWKDQKKTSKISRAVKTTLAAWNAAPPRASGYQVDAHLCRTSAQCLAARFEHKEPSSQSLPKVNNPMLAQPRLQRQSERAQFFFFGGVLSLN